MTSVPPHQGHCNSDRRVQRFTPGTGCSCLPRRTTIHTRLTQHFMDQAHTYRLPQDRDHIRWALQWLQQHDYVHADNVRCLFEEAMMGVPHRVDWTKVLDPSPAYVESL